MTQIFGGANWKTTVFGTLSMVSLFIVGNPDLISGVIGDTDVSKRIFSVAGLVAGYIAFSRAKDKNVTGGNIQQDMNGKTAPETNLVRVTKDVTPIAER